MTFEVFDDITPIWSHGQKRWKHPELAVLGECHVYNWDAYFIFEMKAQKVHEFMIFASSRLAGRFS